MEIDELYSLLKAQYTKQLTESYSYYERKKAWKLFEKLGLPNSKSEIYKYTTPHIWQNFVGIDNTQAKSEYEQKTKLSDIIGYHLIIINGAVSLYDSKLDKADKIFCIYTGEKAFHKRPLFEQVPYKNIVNKNGLVSLNNSLYKQDIYIQIKDNTLFDKPLYIHNAHHNNTITSIINTRIQIDIGKNSVSEIAIINQNFSQICPIINNQYLINLQPNTSATFYNLHLDSYNNSIINNQVICTLDTNSRLKYFDIASTESVIKNNSNIFLNRIHAHAELYGLAIPKASNIVDNYTTVHHNFSHTTSEELYRNVVGQRATAVFNGEIVVRKNTQKVKAYQINDSLLLSENANLHSTPQLKIFTDDVKCSHGATIGQIDPDNIFYLRSRGIPEQTARNMLVQSFIEVILQKVPNLHIKDLIRKNLEIIQH